MRAGLPAARMGNSTSSPPTPKIPGQGGEQRERLFYQAFLHSSSAIEITDRAGVLVDVNPAFERMYGYTRAELIGHKPRIVRSPKTSASVYQTMWRDLLDPGKGEWSGEIINVDRDGREHPVLLTINSIRGEDGETTHFIGVATDLSDLKALQLQTVRAERLASLGQLAAGVAHELNTPLANIMLIAESLHRRAPNPWVSGRAESITAQVDAAARIVAGLLDFGRNHPPVVRDADLVALIHEAVEFVRGKQPPDVEIAEEDETAPLPVRVNRVQIIQVLVNILSNAYDAMDGRGRIDIRSRRTDGWAEVAIADNGPGIDPAVLPHIFEPFFTTKSEGKGTGLGLAICHGIVASHGGKIEVRTEPGAGATFLVRLPREHSASREPPDAA